MAALLQGPVVFGLAPDDEDPVTLPGREWNDFVRRYRQLEEQLAKARESEARKAEEIRRLRDRNRQLESQLRALISSPLVLAGSDRTAEAGSVPSSRAFYRRPRHAKGRRKAGGQPGHAGRARPRPVPNAPPVRLSLDRCRRCGTGLGDPCGLRRRTITELPPPQPLIFDVEIPRYYCPTCGEKVEPEDPFPKYFPFGTTLMAQVLHLRMLGLSVAKIARYMEEGHGVALSPATILRMERDAAELFDPTYRTLMDQVRHQPVLGADETGFRIGGDNGCLCVSSCTHSGVFLSGLAGRIVASFKRLLPGGSPSLFLSQETTDFALWDAPRREGVRLFALQKALP